MQCKKTSVFTGFFRCVLTGVFVAHRQPYTPNTPTSFSTAFFHSAQQLIHLRHRFRLCALQKVEIGARRCPEILMPCTSPHAACLQLRIEAERREPSGNDRRRNRLFKGMRNSDGDAEVESNSKDRPHEQSSSTSKEGWTQKIKRAVVGSH